MVGGVCRAAYLLEVVDDVAVDGGAEATQLAEVGHLAGVVPLPHVGAQGRLLLVLLLTDPTHQHVRLVLVHLGPTTQPSQPSQPLPHPANHRTPPPPIQSQPPTHTHRPASSHRASSLPQPTYPPPHHQPTLPPARVIWVPASIKINLAKLATVDPISARIFAKLAKTRPNSNFLLSKFSVKFASGDGASHGVNRGDGPPSRCDTASQTACQTGSSSVCTAWCRSAAGSAASRCRCGPACAASYAGCCRASCGSTSTVTHSGGQTVTDGHRAEHLVAVPAL